MQDWENLVEAEKKPQAVVNNTRQSSAFATHNLLDAYASQVSSGSWSSEKLTTHGR